MLVRLLKIAGADLTLFDFDYDLTWVGFFLNADEKVYGRYGGRDAHGPDERISLAGLRHAMLAALEAHQRDGDGKPPPGRAAPTRAEEYPAARRMRNECIHCHQVYEFRRDARQKAGLWRPEERWVYPLPENVGVTLEVDRGNHVRAVAPGSAAELAGLRAGDVLRTVNGVPAASQADVQYGLHRAPWQGKVPFTRERDGQVQSGHLQLAAGWKKTNLTWRPSMLEVLPGLTLYGKDLSAAEKQALGLPPARLAFRQDSKVHSHARGAGIRGGDVVLGIDGETLDLTVEGFLAHVRRNYLVGDRLVLRLLRDGKPLTVPLTLK